MTMADSIEYLVHQISKLSLSGCPNIQSDHSEINSRKWFSSGLSLTKLHRKGIEFTVASYNVLSQNLLVRHLDLYNGCDNGHLQWNFRKKRLLEEIFKYNPDILCMQEVHFECYESFFLKELKKKGYYGLYKKRSTEQNEDGCATFFKKNVFKLVECKELEFQHYAGSSHGKHNVALLLVLSFNGKTHNSTLCIANTHLLYNPRRGDVKLTQLMILLAEIHRISWKYPHHLYNDDRSSRCPSILCGDLNLIPQSDLYLFLCRGILQLDKLNASEVSGLPDSQFYYDSYDALMVDCDFVPRRITSDCQFATASHSNTSSKNVITHDLNLTSAYPHEVGKAIRHRNRRNGTKKELQITSSHSNETSLNLDYILYSVHSKRCCFIDGKLQTQITCECGLHLLEWLQLPTTASNIGSLPNETNGSDHVMVMAKFLFL